MLPPGTRIGRYELVRRLAKGGMAELYLARAHGIHGFEKLVVLKLVLPYLAEDRDFVEMFLHEARLAATLDHPNIVHVTDIGEIDGEPFFVMEYVHGQDVRAIMRTASKVGKPLPLSCALTIVAGIATGLHYVHERRGSNGQFLGLVHRDVSPANVVVSYGGSIKLVDFGIAKATELRQSTRSGVLKGKVNYMAPEQCHGVAVDRRTDVFALGILLYETITGKRLFAGDSDFYVMSRIVRGLFAKPTEVKPDLAPDLEAIIMRALSTDREQRHATAQELLADIEGFAHEHRLRLSGLAITDFLRDLFGEQPHPGTEEDELPTMVHPESPGSGPHEAGPSVVRPTAVSVFAEATTNIRSSAPEQVHPTPVFSEATTNLIASASTGEIDVAKTTSMRAADAPTRVIVDPSQDGGEVTTATMPAVAANADGPVKTEPSPRVVLNQTQQPQLATMPTPRLTLTVPKRSPTRGHLGLVLGLGLAAIVAFAVGMSAGTRQRNAASSTRPEITDPVKPAETTPVVVPKADVAPEPRSAPATPTEHDELSVVVADEHTDVEPQAAPPEAETPEAARPSAAAPRPAKKKRARSKDPPPKKPSGLDAMYPSTPRP
jgi:serine/threonine protein kinase